MSFRVINKYGKSSVVQIATVLRSMLLVEGLSGTDFLDNFLTTSFGVHYFGKISAIRVIFFAKCSKFDIDFKNVDKNSKMCFVFEIIVSELPPDFGNTSAILSFF